MAQAAIRRWTLPEFFAWSERQESRYELVNGLPVRMMAGASIGQDSITLNLLGELRNRLRGSRCRPFTGGGAVETNPGQIRRPDAGIDCGTRDPAGYLAAEPVFVAEVLSPSTRDFDTFEKLAEYKNVATMRAILFVEPNRAEVALWSREPGSTWTMTRIEGLDGMVTLAEPAIALPLAEIYADVAFPPAGPMPQFP